jgi:hypothetical protein
MARRATDGMSPEAYEIMIAGFRKKTSYQTIAANIAAATGENLNPRTIGRRAVEWRHALEIRERRKEEMYALVQAAKEGDLAASDMIQAMALDLEAYANTQEIFSFRDLTALKPLQYVVMDHRQLDLFCIARVHPRGWKLLRPWLTAAIDMRTRKWLAWVLV